ncbi:MAG: hypothetical protein K2H76_02750, partial [Muribaculaceae bacterium]|nr:hypothetical protein [Muribaculaceae bacterium]
RERKPIEGKYFYKFNDGSGMAYSPFMGGDQKLTRVKTGAGTGRKLLVIKDSYGNAFPGYMFYSFDEIHIVDFRYFTRNMKKYVRDNGITDLVFCVNVFNAYSSSAAKKMTAFLNQGERYFAADSSSSSSESGSKSGDEKRIKKDDKKVSAEKEKRKEEPKTERRPDAKPEKAKEPVPEVKSEPRVPVTPVQPEEPVKETPAQPAEPEG